MGQNSALLAPFSMDEVRKAACSLGKDKVPGSDEFIVFGTCLKLIFRSYFEEIYDNGTLNACIKEKKEWCFC